MGKVRDAAHNIFVWFFSVFLIFSLGYHIYLAAFFSSGWTDRPALWLSVFLVGFTLTFLAYFVSRSSYYLALRFVPWLGYIWLGFFFLLAAFTIPFQFAMQVWWELNNYKTEWFLFIVFLALYSVYRGLEIPKPVFHKLKTDHENLKGLRLVQITDLHVGQLQHDDKWLKKVIDCCHDLKPDFLLLTGDLVESSLDRIQKEIEVLKAAHAKVDKIFVLGNHEMIHGGAHWENVMKGIGWTVLHNNHKIYDFQGSKLQMAGVPDRMITRFDPQYKSDPELSLRTPESVDYRILLAHEPSSVSDLKETKPDAILSGHTHGGQIFPFHFMVALVQPVVSGWKKIKGVHVFAHPGTGLWGPPMRLGTRNQIAVIDLI